MITCQAEHAPYNEKELNECPRCAALDAQMHRELYAEWQLKPRHEDYTRMCGPDPRTMAYWERYM